MINSFVSLSWSLTWAGRAGLNTNAASFLKLFIPLSYAVSMFGVVAIDTSERALSRYNCFQLCKAQHATVLSSEIKSLYGTAGFGHWRSDFLSRTRSVRWVEIVTSSVSRSFSN